MVPGLRASATVLLSSLPLWSPLSAADELDAVRRQMATLEKQYNERLEALEKRLEEAEARARQQRNAALQSDSSQLAAPTAPRSFNPDLSVILQGSVNSYSDNPDSYAMPGFQLGEEAGLAPQGLTRAQFIFCRA